ncbi:(d)CMP kinase [Portibacter marinus]|uniref:(d)CMP kinase n=1 Tax=Portibacter marinus TaxID=2898660 RepID=UPI001F3992D9|nr:(d)CMP kinase [Portibacter marinus]
MVVAIDGYSACGKSTLAKALAKELNAVYVDTGAMYRAVTLYFLNHKIDITSPKEVAKALISIHITFDNTDGKNECILNGHNIEEDIRTPRVSEFVSEVAAIPVVRRKLVELQRNMSLDKSVVMDGRDIGTVVFPNADHKFFITANPEVRARRRILEYQSKGMEVNEQAILKNLEKRDHIDSNRKDSPLRKADDAILINNSNLDKSEQLRLVLQHIRNQKSTTEQE